MQTAREPPAAAVVRELLAVGELASSDQPADRLLASLPAGARSPFGTAVSCAPIGISVASFCGRPAVRCAAFDTEVPLEACALWGVEAAIERAIGILANAAIAASRVGS